MAAIPKVSVCVPIYNVEPFIERCARSLLEQTYTNLEIIFVDDKSPDNSTGILERIIGQYPDRKNQAVILHHDVNHGLAQSRLTAINHSTGDYIFHLDSDDWVSTDCIEKLVEEAVREKADIVFGNAARVYPSKTIPYNLFYDEDKIEFVKSMVERRVGVAPVIWNRLISRDLHLKILPTPGINYSEDWVTFPRIAFYAQKICKIDSITYFYFQGNQNSYSNSFSEKSKSNLIEASKILIDFFCENTDNIFNESLEKMKRRVILLLYSTGNKSFCKDAERAFPNVALLKGINKRDLYFYTLVKLRLFPLIPLSNKIGVRTKNFIRQLKH